jgi:hypothetical protein
MMAFGKHRSYEQLVSARTMDCDQSRRSSAAFARDMASSASRPHAIRRLALPS